MKEIINKIKKQSGLDRHFSYIGILYRYISYYVTAIIIKIPYSFDLFCIGLGLLSISVTFIFPMDIIHKIFFWVVAGLFIFWRGRWVDD